MEQLKNLEALVVSQKKEWGEILTNFETRNKYVVCSADGEQLFAAGEVGGSLILRVLLKAHRPFTMKVAAPGGETVMILKRPFRFFFHELRILDSAGQQLGYLKKQFSIFRRIYTVYDRSSRPVLTLFGPILHPWTFEIQQESRTIGKITKKWSGLAKEVFTDADNFGVTFPGQLPPELKTLLLGAVFLIDFVHFENTNK